MKNIIFFQKKKTAVLQRLEIRKFEIFPKTLLFSGTISAFRGSLGKSMLTFISL